MLVVLVLASALLAAATSSALVSPTAAQSSFVCDDEIDNDADGQVDWPDAPGCKDDPDWPSEAPLACSDGLDNDADGSIDAEEDPGCRGRSTGADETDPAPVPSTIRILRLTPVYCGIEVTVDLRPILRPRELFPASDTTVRLRGVGGDGRGITRTTLLHVDRLRSYRFQRLKAGRYQVAVTYSG